MKINFGKNLRELRTQKGLTQKQLSELIDVITDSIKNYENNRRTPTLDVIEKIKIVLDVSFDELLKFDTDND